MKFRPCIDIHDGSVKQIVGGALSDSGSGKTNFVSEQDGGFFAEMYKNMGLSGGHIILLNPAGTEGYEKDKEQARLALTEYPGGLMIGGGMNDKNAAEYIEMGASHVIVTSFVFKDGKINYDNLEAMRAAVGKEHLVLDLSCRKRDGQYYIVTDRWQKFTDTVVTTELLEQLKEYCDEYLIHAVDVEGKCSGIEEELAALLGSWGGLPITYAGGVSSFEDLEKLKELGQGRVDVTIGSALDIFGGKMALTEVVDYINKG